MRTFEVSHRDQDLPAGSQRVALTGRPRAIAWPPLCPNCGNPTAERLRIEKVFRRKTRRRPWRYLIAALDVPFCAACAARHRQLVEPPRPLDGWLAVLKSPLLIPLAGACILGAILFRPVIIEGSSDPGGRWVALGLYGFLALAAIASIIGAWRGNRPYRVPRSTEISRAFDYSDNLGNVVTGERRVYAIRNPAFADAFTAANRDHLWTDEIKQRDRRRSTIFGILVVLALVVAWLLMRITRTGS